MAQSDRNKFNKLKRIIAVIIITTLLHLPSQDPESHLSFYPQIGVKETWNMMTNIVMVAKTEKMLELSSFGPKVRPELIPTWHHPLDTIISVPPLPRTCHVLITGTFEETRGMITRECNEVGVTTTIEVEVGVEKAII
jgi:hypothetical protein